MSHRRTLALYILLCFVFGIVAVPAKPQLVCRMTGQAMAPVAELAAGNQPSRSCCAVGTHFAPDGTVLYHLTAPSCCALRQSTGRADVPADKATGVRYAAAIMAATPVIPPAAPTVEIALGQASVRESSPRGPPLRSTPSRAPPSFS